MAGRLSSYRFRRRLLWGGVWLAFVVSSVAVGIAFWNTADAEERFTDEPAQIFVPPRAITLTPRDRQEIAAVARRFLETAVAREHPEHAYELVGPLLRGGMTRAQWTTGDIPVVAYPVDGARWKFEYATEAEVGLSVLLFPKTGEQVRPTVFSMTVAPREPARGWLITAWAPRGGTPSTIEPVSRTPEEAIGGLVERYSTKTSAGWLLLPAFFLALALLLPLVLVARERRAVRRGRRLRAAGPR